MWNKELHYLHMGQPTTWKKILSKSLIYHAAAEQLNKLLCFLNDPAPPALEKQSQSPDRPNFPSDFPSVKSDTRNRLGNLSISETIWPQQPSVFASRTVVTAGTYRGSRCFLCARMAGRKCCKVAPRIPGEQPLVNMHVASWICIDRGAYAPMQLVPTGTP